MTSTLLRHCRLGPRDAEPAAMLIENDTIAWLGSDRTAPASADAVVDVGGAQITPAFVDAHVHATSTGLTLDGLDLSGAASLSDALQRTERYARSRRGGVVLGHGWDETGWPEHRAPTREELDRATYGGVAYLTRIDVHSAVVSSALLAAVPHARSLPGFDESGWLRQDAHHAVRRAAYGTVSAGQRRAAQRTFLKAAAAAGIGCVHEMAGPQVSGVDDAVALAALVAEEPLPDVIVYWGELGGVDTAREIGAAGAGGDLFLDGSIGSHTACLREPYADDETTGVLYLDPAEVVRHIVACTDAGLQAGFHAIGDRALEVLLGDCLDRAAGEVGPDRLRAARHRVEHAEMLDARLIAQLSRYGIVASVQPAFDAAWGGRDGMYAERLGVDRAVGLNPYAAMADAGVALAFGSDSPVTPLTPWASVDAAVRHRTPGSGIAPEAAFAAHTVGGWYAARREVGGAGQLRPGAPATYAVWEAGRRVCLRTVVRGRVVHESDGAFS